MSTANDTFVTTRKAAPELVELAMLEYEADMISTIRESPFKAISTDAWTDRLKRSMEALSISLITPEWELKTYIADFFQIKAAHHTAPIKKEAFLQLFEKYAKSLHNYCLRMFFIH